jgi:hypothetical protein
MRSTLHFSKTLDHTAWALVTLIVLMTSLSFASVQVPKNLSHTDRLEALKILGFNTSSKILSDPYPMGGYSGFELGLSVETIPTEGLSHLGDGLTSPQTDISFAKLSVAKGFYNNVDAFFQFTPYSRQGDLAEYGGILRWGFYQATFLPLSASLLAHVDTGDVGNHVVTQSYGIDLVGGLNVDDISLYAGLGVMEASGTFMGGTDGITDSGQLESENIRGTHTIIGGNIRVQQDGFIAIEFDRYADSVFSVKTGLRY